MDLPQWIIELTAWWESRKQRKIIQQKMLRVTHPDSFRKLHDQLRELSK